MSSDYTDILTPLSALPNIYQWRCPICFFDNPMTNTSTCEMCDYSHSQSDGNLFNSDLSILVWECPWCTMRNTANNVFCESCCQAQPELDYQKPVSADKVVAESIPKSVSVRGRQDQDESYAENRFQEIISKCKELKTHFVDQQFTPSTQSLGRDYFRNFSQWLRIFDISPSSNEDHTLPWTVFSSPQPGDIEQGAIGNCWLMAALALITERPRLLRRILLTQIVNNEGVYFVRICHNGLWKTITIDDCFPCTKHKELVFSRARHRQLYVPLIEKACAKLHGSYANLISGYMFEGLQLLTGAPCDYIDLQPSSKRLDGDIIWAKLVSACESNLLIGASSGRNDITSEEYSQVLIHNNHSFSILAAYALAGGSSRFVLVRDPHARSNYTEKNVTLNVLQQLCLVNDTPRSSGAFWISWAIFLRFFASITISTYNEDHFDARHHGQFTRSATQYVPTYRFHVSQTSSISISLLYHRRDRKARVNHTQSFVLCDTDEETPYGGIGRRENILKSQQRGFTYWSGSLRPGSYVLIPFSISFWGQDVKDNDYTIVIHSSVSIHVNIAKESPTLLADCLMSAVINNYHIMTKKKGISYYVTPTEIKLMLLVVENWSKTNYLNITTSMASSRNLFHSRHSSTSHDTWTTHDYIPPYHRQLIFITEWIGEHRSFNRPKYDFIYEHHTQITDTIKATDNDTDNLHTPRSF